VSVLFLGLALAYVVFLPSFEGPDESEHARYVQAWAAGAEVHPVDPERPLRWGYQVVQPPLYYAVAGAWARVLGLTFHERLVVNPRQNPRFPFLRHDLPGQRFPWDAVNRSLRVLRLLSLLFGVLTFLVLQRGFRMLFPDAPGWRAFLLAGSMLMPNTLQIFAIAGNDAPSLLLGAALVVLAVAVVRNPRPGARVFLGAGGVAGLAVLCKVTGLAALAVAGTLWALDALANRRASTYARGMLYFLPVFLLLAGPLFAANHAWYGDFARENLVQQLTPAFHLDAPRPASRLFALIATHLPSRFAADLGWHSVRLPTLGPLLFWPWLLCAVASGGIAWRQRDADGRIPAELFLPGLCLVWGLAVLIAVNREWTSLQPRHVWSLYPFALIGIAVVGRRLPSRLRTRGRAALAGVLAGLVLMNLIVIDRFRAFHAPGVRVEGRDRDYATFLYTQVKDRDRAQRYLRRGH